MHDLVGLARIVLLMAIHSCRAADGKRRQQRTTTSHVIFSHEASYVWGTADAAKIPLLRGKGKTRKKRISTRLKRNALAPRKRRHSRKWRLVLFGLCVFCLSLVLREVRIRLHFQHLLGVAFAVRGDQQYKFIAVQLAHGAVAKMRA